MLRYLGRSRMLGADAVIALAPASAFARGGSHGGGGGGHLAAAAISATSTVAGPASGSDSTRTMGTSRAASGFAGVCRTPHGLRWRRVPVCL